MLNEHKGHRSRVRDRVKKEGLENFQNYQVLEYVLSFVIPYKDTNLLAHRLINKFGSFAGVLEADEEDLQSIDGLGNVSAHFLTNLLKIFNYYEKDKVKNVVKVVNPYQAYEYVRSFLKDKLIEELYIFCITPKNKVISVEKISEGTMNEVSVQMRNIVDKMNKTKVSNIIIAHNHPKGSSIPSDNDHNFTKALVTNLAINGCHLLDHIIIGENDDDYYSYRCSGLIDEFKKEASELIKYNKISQPMARYDYTIKYNLEVDNDKK